MSCKLVDVSWINLPVLAFHLLFLSDINLYTSFFITLTSNKLGLREVAGHLMGVNMNASEFGHRVASALAKGAKKDGKEKEA